jgi:hypothetical protein
VRHSPRKCKESAQIEKNLINHTIPLGKIS